MTTAALITKLKKKIEKEKDPNILKTIDMLLDSETKQARIKQRMTEMAILSDQAIKSGDVVPWEEVRIELQAKIDKHAKSRSERGKRA